MAPVCGFDLIREQTIPELNSQARLYRHAATGAELLAVSNDDENKTFAAAFRTLPSDHTGVPHILEHSVLGGSRRYPVKEPFVELLKSSLATFINAFTMPDTTMYPIASQNLQDFYNLMDVYLDAIFAPELARHTFEQEGWHYELDSPDGPLAFRGIVFNEMKGAMSEPEETQTSEGLSALLPDTPYAWHYGGDPEHIPDLSYEQFKQFYATYYHPSNARFLVYGDAPIEDTLCRIDTVIAGFGAAAPVPGVPLQARFAAPRTARVPYMARDGGEAKTYVTVSWVTIPADDPVKVLSADILGYALTGSPASPLRKALIDSGLGEELTEVGGGQLRQLVFSAGLKGVAPENAARVEPLVLETLETLARDGVDPATIEAALNTIEFHLRENDMFGGQRGIVFMLRALSTWLYGGDPFAPVAFEEPLAQVKANLQQDPAYFSKMIHEYLLDNPHRVTLILEPDPALLQAKEAGERARLERMRGAMSQAEVQAVIENTRTLKELQQAPNSPEALATLPVLQRSDLDRKIRTIPLEEASAASTPVLYHPLPTNGIVYLDLAFDLRALPASALPYLTVLGRVLLEMGTETEDYVRLTQRIGRTTGGIRPTTFISATRDPRPGPAWFILRGKAMSPNAGEMLAIMRDVLLQGRLDDANRLRQILLEEKARREAGLLGAGHELVSGRLQAHYTENGWLNDQIGGFAGLFTVRQMLEDLERQPQSVSEHLLAVRKALVNRPGMLANVTLQATQRDTFAPVLADFLAQIPDTSVQASSWSRPDFPAQEAFALPAQVNYVGKGANLYALGYHLHGSIFAINRYLNTTWLWQKVRAEGGAYGGSASFDFMSGMFTYASYRDPNILSTLDNFDGSPEFLRTVPLDEDEVTKAVIAAIGRMDAYQLPAAKGFTSLARYLTGQTDERRQLLRDELLTTTPENFRAFAHALEDVRARGEVVVMGAEEALQAAAQQRAGMWAGVTRLL